MKKAILIGLIVVVALVALGVAGYAYAQTTPTPTPGFPFGFGRMGRHGGMRGAWGYGKDGYGPMHEYMEDALAEALDMSHEELEEQLEQGKTIWQIAQDEGLTEDEFRDLMTAAHTEALEKMVDDGVITQEQADWMKNRMSTMWDWMWKYGGGFGGCPGMGGGFGGRSPSWRWNNPPAQSTPSPSSY